MISPESGSQAFIDQHVARIEPLCLRENLAAWQAAVSGDESAIKASAEARAAVKRVYADPDGFRRVKELVATGPLEDPSVHRQLVLLDMAFTINQLPEETIADLSGREAELEGIFYNFRASLDGAEVSNNDLREMLASEPEGGRRRRIWEASKAIGPLVAPRLLELVRRRNEAARGLGYANFHALELAHQEIDAAVLRQLLEDFSRASDPAFRAIKSRLDAELSSRHGVGIDDLRPWHWEDFFSQDAPVFGSLDLDRFFCPPLDHEEVSRDYFANIGLPVDAVLARSDLYEREGKDQHAFCTDIDRQGDVRILCNLRPNERWMKTLLHELGHAVYDINLPRSLPFLLRRPAHTLSTESIAMFFGRLTRNPEWLREVLDVHLTSAEIDAVNEQQRLSMLIAARWMLVMIHFERELYENPDRPDLNRLWWDLVEEHQLIRRPDDRDEPDWASKIHLALSPVYYHNYLLGEFMASQLTYSLNSAGADGQSLGLFLRERIFDRGASLPWNDLLREATGEPLTSRYFVEQFA